ncbi:hypothetical protein BK653_27310 [Pseudomonas brassicacearum]|nr:hypothetical protein BK653_27310 [Pseudomonas brassicacearum]
MSFAKELLDNSQMPITSIGYEAGFKDPSYFVRAFKQYATCTPSEYRSAYPTRSASPTRTWDDMAVDALESPVHSLEG